MTNLFVFLFLGVLVLVLATLAISFKPSHHPRHPWMVSSEHFINTSNAPEIICIMITGKDTCRKTLAQASVANFHEQTYPNKKLVIINHAPFEIMDDPNLSSKNVFEFHVDKEQNALTLGDMRNIALEMVPHNALWTPWDDDDYRSPDYLSLLYNLLVKHDADVVAYTSRLEFNNITKLIWKMTLKSGFVQVLAKKDGRLRYMEKDSMEDTNLIVDANNLGLKVHVEDNDPRIYVRLVHGDNTSKYVNHNKKQVRTLPKGSNYIESDVTAQEKVYVQNIILNYYKDSITCSIPNKNK